MAATYASRVCGRAIRTMRNTCYLTETTSTSTFPTNDRDADIEIVTPQEKIDRGRSNLQIVNLHLAHEPRQDRVVEDHLALRRQ